MGIAVKFLPEDAIEADAEALLAEYSSKYTPVVVPPIPVDEILEIHLGFKLDLDDLHERLGIPKKDDEPDILGATWLATREVFIDQSLDPHINNGNEGRYHFTVGHEIGHCRLHPQYFTPNPSQFMMNLPDVAPKPAVICRRSMRKERIEWQADFFSSCLLMPKAMVFKAWERRFGDLNPYVFDPNKLCFDEPIMIVQLGLAGKDYRKSRFQVGFDCVAREFAPLFRVSVQAMRIRLEKLGLLVGGQTLPMFGANF